MTSLIHRAETPLDAVAAEGCWVRDAEGNSYLDAASGAMVVNVGHADSSVIAAVSEQLQTVDYVHPSVFTVETSERYASELSARLPMDRALIYPVSGGSEAVETALKAARAFHVARGETDRTVVIGRELSYHGNTRGALDVSGRVGLRAPYLPWLGHAGRVPGVLEYRCPNPDHPGGCAAWHAARLEEEIDRIGPDRVAAFIAEPIGGAASGAAVPPEGYWSAISEVCARSGILVIADEVMTGFGRTGAWFASSHFGVTPDLMTLAKGASSGYWPLGICAMSQRVGRVLDEGEFIHGFTYSHQPAGAAAGMAVIRRIEELDLVTQARDRGSYLLRRVLEAVGEHPHVGDVRGLGLLLAVELVSDRETKDPFPPGARIASALAAAAREAGLLVYPAVGCAGDGRGDLVLIGPPLIVDEEEADMIASRLDQAFRRMAWA